MEAHDLVLITIGVVAFSLFSRRAEKGILTSPMAFMLFGLLISPTVLDLMEIQFHSALINDLAEITLALALFTDASRINIQELDTQHDLPLRLLGIGLPLTIAAGMGVALLLFPGVTVWEAGIIGVILAPTDAALGQSVVNNPRVPVRIRQALNVESGLNDGLAFPALLVFLSLASTSVEGRDFTGWLVFIGKQLVIGPLAGAFVGYTGAVLADHARKREWMSHIFLQIYVLALALLAYGFAELIGGNGFIAAFAAGLTVGAKSSILCQPLEDFGETEGQLLSLIVFLLFGSTMVPRGLESIGWRDVAYAVLSLTAVRMGPVALCLWGKGLKSSTVAFLGWFGPRGLASILYLLLIFERGGVSASNEIFSTVVCTVLFSILAHGMTASPGALLYANHMEKLKEKKMPEHKDVHEFPTRLPHVRRVG
ncbi:MAG: cation:proton antiporter [Acidobacteriota bacterium]